MEWDSGRQGLCQPPAWVTGRACPIGRTVGASALMGGTDYATRAYAGAAVSGLLAMVLSSVLLPPRPAVRVEGPPYDGSADALRRSHQTS